MDNWKTKIGKIDSRSQANITEYWFPRLAHVILFELKS